LDSLLYSKRLMKSERNRNSDRSSIERKGKKTMANIQHHVLSHITGSIYGIAGYYSDIDSTQHVVAATNDGTLYEIHWNRNTAPTPPQRLAQFNGIASLSGFSTSDDDFQHVIVAT